MDDSVTVIAVAVAAAAAAAAAALAAVPAPTAAVAVDAGASRTFLLAPSCIVPSLLVPLLSFSSPSSLGISAWLPCLGHTSHHDEPHVQQARSCTATCLGLCSDE